MTHTTSSSGKGTRALRLATGLAGLLLLLAGSAAATSASTNTRGVAIPPKRETALERLVGKKGGAGGSSEPADGKIVATPGQAFVTGLLSGAVAGITVDLTLFPLDTIKTRLQASRDVKLSWKIFEGIYDGVGPGLAASAPACAAFFGAYDTLRRTLSERFPDPKCAVLVNMAAAAGGDLTQSVVRVPFEVVKQRMQAGVEKTWREAVSNILASSGPKGFFAGWGALALRDLPFDLIEFPLYEALKELWAERKGGKLETWESSLCGSLAGGIAAGLTTPLDVVKTRLMTQTGGAGAAGNYKGLLDCLVRVAKEEGVGALYRGLVPRVVNIALGGAIFFGAYEAFKKVADRAIVQKDLDLGEWWADVKARAHSMRTRQMNGGVAGGKRGGFLPATAFVAGPARGGKRC